MKAHAPIDFSILALNKGDKKAFSNAFLKYYSALCHFSLKIVGDADDAEDIAEELFLKLWSRHETFESEQHLKAYLYQAIRNASLNYLKLYERSGHRNTEFTVVQGTEQASYVHEIIRTEIAREIYQAIQALPPQCGKVISMSYLDGLTNQEIADKMGPLHSDNKKPEDARPVDTHDQFAARYLFPFSYFTLPGTVRLGK